MENERIIEILEGEYKTMSVWLGSSKECREHNEAISIAIEAVKNMQRWIPCSERLPKRSVEVLTCDNVWTIEVRSLEASYDGIFYWESQEGECERLSDAIAWMPLPEPYKEAE